MAVSLVKKLLYKKSLCAVCVLLFALLAVSIINGCSSISTSESKTSAVNTHNYTLSIDMDWRYVSYWDRGEVDCAFKFGKSNEKCMRADPESVLSLSAAGIHNIRLSGYQENVYGPLSLQPENLSLETAVEPPFIYSWWVGNLVERAKKPSTLKLPDNIHIDFYVKDYDYASFNETMVSYNGNSQLKCDWKGQKTEVSIPARDDRAEDAVSATLTFTCQDGIYPQDDSDGDGVVNTDDNCVDTPNPDQLDFNNDGKGDACNYVVVLRGGTFDPKEERESYAINITTSTETGYYVVQFDPGYDFSQLNGFLAETNSVLYADVQLNAVIIKSSQSKAQLQSKPSVRWVGIYQPTNRIFPSLFLNTILDKDGKPINPNADIKLRIYGFEKFSEAAINKLKGYSDNHVTILEDNLVEIETLQSIIPVILMNIPEVSYMSEPPEYKLNNDYSNEIINDGNLVTPPGGGSKQWQRINGLDGKGQVVAVIDSGLDTGIISTLSPDFSGKVQSIVPLGHTPPTDATVDFSGHGTHVAGSVVGQGSNLISNPQGVPSGQGVAPGAKIIFLAVGRKTDVSERGKKKPFPDVCFNNPEVDGNGNYVYGNYSYTNLAGLPDSLQDIFNPLTPTPAYIYTNSWGTCQGVYDQEARDVDRYIWANGSKTILFAAGNSAGFRYKDPVGQIVTRIDDSLDNAARAKNIVTVGASQTSREGQYYPRPVGNNPQIPEDIPDQDENKIAKFSSRGWQVKRDGVTGAVTTRIKPDVVAPGTFILSARSTKCISNNGVKDSGGNYTTFNHASCVGRGEPLGTVANQDQYTYMSGTSMATPLVAGAAALARQYFKDFRGYTGTPSAALIKAALLHGAGGNPAATIPANATPNNSFGWGRVDIKNALFPDGRYTMLNFKEAPDTAITRTGETSTALGVRFSSTYPLEITLVWADAAGSYWGNLTNDLDLELRYQDPNNQLVAKGNVFSNIIHEGRLESKFATAVPGRDQHNNVEKIFIPEPKDGFYNIIVRGKKIRDIRGKSGQPFALMISRVVGVDAAIHNGSRNSEFLQGDNIALEAVGLPAGSTSQPKNVVVDVIDHSNLSGVNFLNSGTFPLPPAVASATLQTDKDGKIDSSNIIWKSNRTGTFNIVIDVNNDRNYTKGIDVVDNSQSYGFEVKARPANNTVPVPVPVTTTRQTGDPAGVAPNVQTPSSSTSANLAMGTRFASKRVTISALNYNAAADWSTPLMVLGPPNFSRAVRPVAVTLGIYGGAGNVKIWQNPTPGIYSLVVTTSDSLTFDSGQDFYAHTDLSALIDIYDGNPENAGTLTAMVNNGLLANAPEAVRQLKAFLNAWTGSTLNTADGTLNASTISAIGAYGNEPISFFNDMANISFIVIGDLNRSADINSQVIAAIKKYLKEEQGTSIGTTGGNSIAKRNFSLDDPVFLEGSGFPSDTQQSVFIVADEGIDWGETYGLPLAGLKLINYPSPAGAINAGQTAGEANNLYPPSNARQIISTKIDGSFNTKIWQDENNSKILATGKRYNTVIDVDQDGIFNAGVDVVDTLDMANFIEAFKQEGFVLKLNDTGPAVVELNVFLSTRFDGFNSSSGTFDQETQKYLYQYSCRKEVNKQLADIITSASRMGFRVIPQSKDADITGFNFKTGARYFDKGIVIRSSSVAEGASTLLRSNAETDITDFANKDSGLIVCSDGPVKLGGSLFRGEAGNAEVNSSRSIHIMPGTELGKNIKFGVHHD